MVFPARTEAVVGATETLTGRTVIVAVLVFVVSNTDVAVIVTVRALVGGVEGPV